METAALELEAPRAEKARPAPPGAGRAAGRRAGAGPGAGGGAGGAAFVRLEYLFPDLTDTPLFQPVWKPARGALGDGGGASPTTPLRAFAARGSNHAAALKLVSALRRVARLGVGYSLGPGRCLVDRGLGIVGVPVEGLAVEALAYHGGASGSLVLLGVARASPGTASFHSALLLAREAAGRLASLAGALEAPRPGRAADGGGRAADVARLLGEDVRETADTLGFELSCAFATQAALAMRERGIEPADLPQIVEGALFGTPCMTLRSVARVALALGADVEPPRLGAGGEGRPL